MFVDSRPPQRMYSIESLTSTALAPRSVLTLIIARAPLLTFR
jgi:hypothetical protein